MNYFDHEDSSLRVIPVKGLNIPYKVLLYDGYMYFVSPVKISKFEVDYESAKLSFMTNNEKLFYIVVGNEEESHLITYDINKGVLLESNIQEEPCSDEEERFLKRVLVLD